MSDDTKTDAKAREKASEESTRPWMMARVVWLMARMTDDGLRRLRIFAEGEEQRP
jgi:hypothetical protein